MTFGRRPGLDVATRVVDGRVIVVPRGELDATTAPHLSTTLATAADRAGVLVLDLRELNFIDSAGLRVVLAAADGGAAAPARFFAVRGPRRIHRLFEMTGMVDSIRWLAVPEAAPRGAE